MTVTAARKSEFCRELLSAVSSKLGFLDVGAGGKLKDPWNLLPLNRINKLDFDPEERRTGNKLPICISNQARESDFYVARDPRSSSLHKASPAFIERFDQHNLLARKVIRVTCATLDQYLAGRYAEVDLVDVNVEGHDFHVLLGADRLLAEGFVKCIKVEFELTEVWQGQGWFSDVDPYLRSKQYDLVDVDIEFFRPARVKSIFHKGEPVWGKAIYLPSLTCWSQRAGRVAGDAYREDVIKAVALYTILDVPGRAVDLVSLIRENRILEPLGADEIVWKIFSVFKYARWDAACLLWTDMMRRVLNRLLPDGRGFAGK